AAYAGRKVGVLGLGKAGASARRALEAAGAEVFVWDDKQAGEGITPAETWPWVELAALVASPGVPLTHPAPHPVIALAKAHGVPVVGDIELLWQACPNARYVGITGTNGKSTTTSLIAHILSQAGEN